MPFLSFIECLLLLCTMIKQVKQKFPVPCKPFIILCTFWSSLFYMADIICVCYPFSHSVSNCPDCFHFPSYFPYLKSEFPTLNTVLIWSCIAALYKYTIIFSMILFLMDPKMFSPLLFLEYKKILNVFWNFLRSYLNGTFVIVILMCT